MILCRPLVIHRGYLKVQVGKHFSLELVNDFLLFTEVFECNWLSGLKLLRLPHDFAVGFDPFSDAGSFGCVEGVQSLDASDRPCALKLRVSDQLGALIRRLVFFFLLAVRQSLLVQQLLQRCFEPLLRGQAHCTRSLYIAWQNSSRFQVELRPYDDLQGEIFDAWFLWALWGLGIALLLLLPSVDASLAFFQVWLSIVLLIIWVFDVDEKLFCRWLNERARWALEAQIQLALFNIDVLAQVQIDLSYRLFCPHVFDLKVRLKILVHLDFWVVKQTLPELHFLLPAHKRCDTIADLSHLCFPRLSLGHGKHHFNTVLFFREMLWEVFHSH